jgi:hypothetical protein
VSLAAQTSLSVALKREESLDVIVTPIVEGKAWNLTDRLGRPMGQITEVSAKQFTLHPEGYALETMADIENRRGACRRNPGEDQS